MHELMLSADILWDSAKALKRIAQTSSLPSSIATQAVSMGRKEQWTEIILSNFLHSVKALKVILSVK